MIYKVLDEPNGWSDQLHLKGVRKGEAWARPRRMNKSLLIPLEEGKDLATVTSSTLIGTSKLPGDHDRRGNSDEEDRGYMAQI